MKFFLTVFIIHLVVVLKAQDVKALHLLNYTNDELLDSLSENLEGLSEKGINTIFLEVDYHFDFKSHPELRQTENVITKKSAAKSNHGAVVKYVASELKKCDMGEDTAMGAKLTCSTRKSVANKLNEKLQFKDVEIV